MIRAEEKRKLMQQLRASASPMGAVLRSLGGIVVLLIIAAGPWTLLALIRE
jgi:hypothetical protein